MVPETIISTVATPTVTTFGISQKHNQNPMQIQNVRYARDGLAKLIKDYYAYPLPLTLKIYKNLL